MLGARAARRLLWENRRIAASARRLHPVNSLWRVPAWTPSRSRWKTTEPSRAKRAVLEAGSRLASWRAGDLMAVWCATFLVLCIVTGPTVFRNARENEYEDIVDDEITALTRLVLERAGAEGEEGVVVNGLREIACDVLGSEAVTRALVRLASRVLESPEVVEASGVLLRGLVAGALEDPRTLEEVVELLRAAVNHEGVKEAVVRLVEGLCEDEGVMKAFAGMVVRISEEEEILEATQSLLTQGTHKTLNDPDVLDHSMEFAADVVGDDVVLRTSAEALRKTITYSVQPKFSTVMSLLGLSSLATALYLCISPAQRHYALSIPPFSISSVPFSLLSVPFRAANRALSSLLSLPPMLLRSFLSIRPFSFLSAPFCAANSALSSLLSPSLLRRLLSSLSAVNSQTYLLISRPRALAANARNSLCRLPGPDALRVLRVLREILDACGHVARSFFPGAYRG